MMRTTLFSVVVYFFAMPAFPQFKHVTQDQVDVMQKLVILNGYKCDSVSEMLPMIFGYGFTIYCNDFRYEYKIEDKGGNIVVTVK